MTCIIVGIILALTVPIATLLLVVLYAEGQSKRRQNEDSNEDLFYGDDAEIPREFRGLSGRMGK